jgi:tetratricopeptide (TPR) repeat protein
VGLSWRSPVNPQIKPATPAQTLILVTHFANYASSEVGYNVAGRLAEALQREIDELRLAEMRVEIWPEPVGERGEALRVGQVVSATLVIYGEYDAGRVVVEFAHPPKAQIFADPALRQHVISLADLAVAINSDLPQQVRSLALMALGQIYLEQNRVDQARPLLLRARDNLQGDETAAEKTWALVNFYVGLASQRSDPPDLDAAIAAYDQAVAHWPEMLSSRLNRIAAYERRNQPGDLALALADAEAVIRAKPAWAVAYNNRASIRLALGGAENLALALTDLEQALALDPELPEAYLNRAFVRFGQGLPVAEVRPDVEQALALRPGYASAYNLLCWGYALEQAVDTALPFCEQAVAAAPNEPLFRDSRGVALVLRGDYPAASADFEAYVAWLETEQPGFDWERDLRRRRAWIEALKRGQSPFRPELLETLRAEFGQ